MKPEPTPRTDAEYEAFWKIVPDFARQLERENVALVAALESAADRMEGFTHRIGFMADDKQSLCDAMASTATEAREEINSIRAALARATGGTP